MDSGEFIRPIPGNLEKDYLKLDKDDDDDDNNDMMESSALSTINARHGDGLSSR